MRFVLVATAFAVLVSASAAMILFVPSTCSCEDAVEAQFLEVTIEPTRSGAGLHFLSEATNRGESSYLPPNGTWSATLTVTDGTGKVVYRTTSKAPRVTSFEPGRAIGIFNTYWDFSEPYPVGPGTYTAEVVLSAGITRTSRIAVEV